MEKKITIEGKEIKVKACASTAIRYQQTFGEHIDKELFQAVGKKEDEFSGGIYESAGKLLYIMAWHCDPALELNRDAALKWLDGVGAIDAKAIKEVMLLFFRK